LDLKNNPLDADLQLQAGKCLNQNECRLCAGKVLQYIKTNKEEYDKEQAIKLKKKQSNDKAKAKKREKQIEKEREEKRSKRLENAQKRLTEKEQDQKENTKTTDEENNKIKTETKTEHQTDGLSTNNIKILFPRKIILIYFSVTNH
jgi:hypothetical protein